MNYPFRLSEIDLIFTLHSGSIENVHLIECSTKRVYLECAITKEHVRNNTRQRNGMGKYLRLGETFSNAYDRYLT